MSRRLRARAQRDGGASSIELALLTPVVLLILLVFVQTAMWFYARQLAQTAVDQGARSTRAFDGTEAEGRAVTTSFFNRSGGPAVTDGAATPIVHRGLTTVSVVIKTQSVSVIPGWHWAVKVQAGGPVERFVPDTP